MTFWVPLSFIGLLTTVSPAFGGNPAPTDQRPDTQRAAPAATHPIDYTASQHLVARLFLARDIKKQLESQGPGRDARRQTLTPEIICGLTLWRVDSSQDPRMIVPIPDHPRVDAKIRRITPNVCLDSSATKR